MSLLNDLENLDLSAIKQARELISGSMFDDELKTILEGDLGQMVLGELGGSLATLKDNFSDPTSLLSPLVNGLEELGGGFNIDAKTLDDLLEKVEQGTDLFKKVLDIFDGESDFFDTLLGFRISDTTSHITSLSDGSTQLIMKDVGKFRYLVNQVEKGLPLEPDAFVDLVLKLLLQVPKEPFVNLRKEIDGLTESVTTISLPTERINGLLSAVNKVTQAANTADIESLRSAVAHLNSIRAGTITNLNSELQKLSNHIKPVQFSEAISCVLNVSKAIDSLDEGILELLGFLKDTLQHAREMFNELDPANVGEALDFILDFLENVAKVEIADPVDQQVENLKAWLNDVFGALTIRSLREKLHNEISKIAEAIQDADLDRFADDVKDKLKDINSAIEKVDLGDDIQAVLQNANTKIRTALNTITGALDTIKNQVTALAGEAEQILQQGADIIAGFKTQIDEITNIIENLGIEKAAQQVIDKLTELRKTAEDLLSSQPLPDALRPLIEQLVKQIEKIDLDEVLLGPVENATAELRIGQTVSEAVNKGLSQMKDALDNLIPEKMIADIEAELDEALEKLRAFDPATLIGKLQGFIDEAVDLVGKLEPSEVLDEIRKPFQAILDVVDELHPDALLKPVYAVYDDVFSNLSLPSADAMSDKVGGALGKVGDTLRSEALNPVTELAGGPSRQAGLKASGAEPSPLGDLIKPGDIVLFLGYLPNKIREALTKMNEQSSALVMQNLNAISGNLVEDLRNFEDVIADIEPSIIAALDAVLDPLAAAQLEAETAIHEHFILNGNAVNVDIELEALTLITPVHMQEAVMTQLSTTCSTVRALSDSFTGEAAAQINEIALQLEKTTLVTITGSVQNLIDALDIEPFAAELDQFVVDLLELGATVLPQINDEIQSFVQRLLQIVNDYNPGSQLTKFVTLLDVVQEEINILNPRTLGQDLSFIHAAIKESISAYDPANLAGELSSLLTTIADKLEQINLNDLIGDISFLDDIKESIDGIKPSTILAGIGTELETVGKQLLELNPSELLASVDGVVEGVDDAFELVVEQIKKEIIALLESIQFAGGGASASASTG